MFSVNTSAKYILIVLLLSTAIYLRIDYVHSIAIGFDEAWHLFIARQASWFDFWQNMQSTVHPPGYFVLLKLVSPLVNDVFEYRYISFFFFILWVLTLHKIADLLQYGFLSRFILLGLACFSFGSYHMSLVIRGYMLSIFFSTLAYYFLLRYQLFSKTLALVAFGVFAVLACLSHLSQGIFCLAILILLSAQMANSYYQKRKVDFRLLGICSFLALAILSIKTFFVRENTTDLIGDFLNQYYFYENFASFLWVNSNLLLRFIYPGLIGETKINYVLVLLIGIGCSLVALARKNMRQHYFLFPLVTLSTMLLLNIVLAVHHKYPYGGDLRHSLFLLPFFLLVISSALELLWRSVNKKGRAVLIATTLGLFIPFTLHNLAFFNISTIYYTPRNFWRPAKIQVDINQEDRIYYLSGTQFLVNIVDNKLLDRYMISLIKEYDNYRVYRLSSTDNSFLVMQEINFGDVDEDKSAIYSLIPQLLEDFPDYTKIQLVVSYNQIPYVDSCPQDLGNFVNFLRKILGAKIEYCQLDFNCQRKFSVLDCNFTDM